MSHAKRTDNNHAEIRDRLRDLGYKVMDTHHLPGACDLWTRARNNYPIVLEVKNGPGDKLTEAEQRLFDLWPLNVFRVESVQQAIDILRELENEGD